MTDIALLGQGFVDRAAPKFRRFKSDLEAIGSAIVKAMEAGELSRDQAQDLFIDHDYAVSVPLQRLYLDRGHFDPVVQFHRATVLITTPDWPTPLAQAALDGFVAAGEGAFAVALARCHLEKRGNALRAHIRERARKPPRKLDAEAAAIVRVLSSAMVEEIPERKAELLAALDRFAPLFDTHGGEEDRAWLAGLRAEAWTEKRI